MCEELAFLYMQLKLFFGFPRSELYFREVLDLLGIGNNECVQKLYSIVLLLLGS